MNSKLPVKQWTGCFLCTLVLILLLPFCLTANNIQINSEPVLSNLNKNDSSIMITFDISWENSWRTSVAPANYDAAWVFVKYKIGENGLWKHAMLSTNSADFSVTNSGAPTAFTPASDGVGVFIHRSMNGSGNMNLQGVKLKWKYGAEPDMGTDVIYVKVFAIEMVYVPQGAFYVGDGGDAGYPRFKTGAANSPFLINSEDAITLGGTSASNLASLPLGWPTGPSNKYNDDFSDASTKILPATYPKGYKGFYMMRYELTQQGYVDFLNTLTRQQQRRRVESNIMVSPIVGIYVMTETDTVKVDPYYDTDSYRNGITTDATFADPNAPLTFYCDVNENRVFNEADDGQNLPANFLHYYDISAYLDWAGLRSPTELEIEKAARGPLTPVANEYAWGSTALDGFEGEVSNMNMTNEVPTTSANIIFPSSDADSWIPARVGSTATGGTNRVTAGASYYGIMDMSGNMYEVAVGIGWPEGRIYDGRHGNGTLDANGYADVLNWPGEIFRALETPSYCKGIGLRMGNYSSYDDTDPNFRFQAQTISMRYFANYTSFYRGNFYTVRGVRTVN